MLTYQSTTFSQINQSTTHLPINQPLPNRTSAPEHLIIQTREPRTLLRKVESAGSVFIGEWSPESIGDYCSGTNHVLPTFGYARSYSGVSLLEFQKRITVQELSAEGLRALGPTAVTLAGMEGLDAHGNAVRVRLDALAKGPA